jgi:hypothetical protein
LVDHFAAARFRRTEPPLVWGTKHFVIAIRQTYGARFETRCEGERLVFKTIPARAFSRFIQRR